MYSTDRYPCDSHTRKDMSSDLKAPHRERGPEDRASRSSEFRELDGGAHEKQTERSDEAELDEGEGDGVAESSHD